MMLALKIQVHKSSFHLFQFFQPPLERLSDVVRLAKIHFLRKHNVHFNKEVGTKMESTDGVDVRHLRMVIERDESQLLQKSRSCGVPSQQFDLLWK